MFAVPDAGNDAEDDGGTVAGDGAPDKPSSGGCLKAQVGFRQLPPSQYQQSLGLILALSLCRYSQSLPFLHVKGDAKK